MSDLTALRQRVREATGPFAFEDARAFERDFCAATGIEHLSAESYLVLASVRDSKDAEGSALSLARKLFGLPVIEMRLDKDGDAEVYLDLPDGTYVLAGHSTLPLALIEAILKRLIITRDNGEGNVG